MNVLAPPATLRVPMSSMPWMQREQERWCQWQANDRAVILIKRVRAQTPSAIMSSRIGFADHLILIFCASLRGKFLCFFELNAPSLLTISCVDFFPPWACWGTLMFDHMGVQLAQYIVWFFCKWKRDVMAADKVLESEEWVRNCEWNEHISGRKNVLGFQRKKGKSFTWEEIMRIRISEVSRVTKWAIVGSWGAVCKEISWYGTHSVRSGRNLLEHCGWNALLGPHVP
jgi:hypothetical protein